MTTQTPQSFSATEADGDPTLSSSAGGTSARDRAAHVGGTAKDQAAGVAQEAKYQARDLAGEARSQVRQQLDTQKGRLSDLLREIGEELEQMADGSDRNGVAADLVRQVASRTRDVRGYLDGDGDILRDVRRFARRRPGTFLLGAAAAGVLAGRATRAAAAARKQQQSSSSSSASESTGWTAGTGTPSTSPGYAGEYATAGSYSGYSTGQPTGYATAEPTAGFAAAGAAPTATYATPEPTGSYVVEQETSGGQEFYAEQGTAYSPATGVGEYVEDEYAAGTNPAGTTPAGTTPAAGGYVVPDTSGVRTDEYGNTYPAGTLPPEEERR